MAVENSRNTPINHSPQCPETALEQRLIDLEERYSFQEEAVTQLSDIVARQDRQIDVLAQELKLCKEQLEGLRERSQSGEGGANAADERPPHY